VDKRRATPPKSTHDAHQTRARRAAAGVGKARKQVFSEENNQRDFCEFRYWRRRIGPRQHQKESFGSFLQKERLPYLLLLALYQSSLKMTHSARRASRTQAASKAFFSEEKKQKTFAISGVCAERKVRDSIR
jgi:hypothetical protein